MVHCHRNVLAAQSPVFSQLLQQMGPPNPTSKGGKVSIPLLSVPSSVMRGLRVRYVCLTHTHARTHTHTHTHTLGEHSSGVRPRCIQRCAHLHVLGAPHAAPRFCVLYLHILGTLAPPAGRFCVNNGKKYEHINILIDSTMYTHTYTHENRVRSGVTLGGAAL